MLSQCLMRIHAALVPPEEALQHLVSALRAIRTDQAQLSWSPLPQWQVRLATFGSVVLSDLLRLEDVLTTEVGQIAAPRLQLSGVVPLPVDGDDAVWVGLAGEADVLSELAARMPDWVRSFGFLLDRRSFRLGMPLARITAHTTVPYLEHISDRVGSYLGPSWVPEGVALCRRQRDNVTGDAVYEVLKVLPFSPAPGGGQPAGDRSHA